MRPAHQIALRASDPLQKLPHQGHLRRLARVRRTGEREILARQFEMLDRAVLDERQCLKRFCPRAPEGAEIRIACARREAA